MMNSTTVDKLQDVTVVTRTTHNKVFPSEATLRLHDGSSDWVSAVSGPPDKLAPPGGHDSASALVCESVGSIDKMAESGHSTGGGVGGGGDDVTEPDSPCRLRTATPSEVETRTDVAIDMTNSTTPKSQKKLLHNSLSRRNGNSYTTHFMRSAPYKRIKHPADKSLFLSFLGSIFFLIIALALLGPAAVVYVIILPIGYIIKNSLASCCCCCIRSGTCVVCCNGLLSHSDISWLHDSPLNRAVGQAIFTIEHGVDLKAFRALVHTNMVANENKNGDAVFPRFTQKIVPLLSGYVWAKDEEFSIDNHIYSMPDSIRTIDDLTEHVGEQASKELPLDRPLWDMQVLCDFGHAKETVVLFRVHPCLSDGISLIRIFFRALADNNQEANWNFKPRFSQGALAFNVFRGIFVSPVVFLQKWLLTRRDHNFLHRRGGGGGGGLSGKKVVAWSEPFSASRAHRVKQVTRSTLNDILLTVTAGVLRIYLQKQGVSNPFDVHAALPVDLRSDDVPLEMGTQFSLIDVRLPINTEGTIPRLWAVKHRMDEVKNSADPVVLYSSHWLLHYILPASLLRRLWSFYMNKMSCLVSTLPGPDHPVTISGREVTSMAYWMAPTDSVALSISFMTYADQLCMTVTADEAIVPNPGELCADFILQMETLSQLLANRRIPGEHAVRRTEMNMHDSSLGEEATVEQIQTKMTDVQHQLQELKTRLDLETQEKFVSEEHVLMSRVEELKEEFRELLAELRRKKAADGSPVLSEDEDDEDGEVIRPYRKRSLSISSRRSSSSNCSTARPLTTAPTSSSSSSSHAPPHYQPAHYHPPGSASSSASSTSHISSSRPHTSTPSSPTVPVASGNASSRLSPSSENHQSLVNHEENDKTYSPQVERKH